MTVLAVVAMARATATASSKIKLYQAAPTAIRTPVYSVAMSTTKRYLTSLFSMRS